MHRTPLSAPPRVARNSPTRVALAIVILSTTALACSGGSRHAPSDRDTYVTVAVGAPFDQSEDNVGDSGGEVDPCMRISELQSLDIETLREAMISAGAAVVDLDLEPVRFYAECAPFDGGVWALLPSGLEPVPENPSDVQGYVQLALFLEGDGAPHATYDLELYRRGDYAGILYENLMLISLDDRDIPRAALTYGRYADIEFESDRWIFELRDGEIARFQPSVPICTSLDSNGLSPPGCVGRAIGGAPIVDIFDYTGDGYHDLVYSIFFDGIQECFGAEMTYEGVEFVGVHQGGGRYTFDTPAARREAERWCPDRPAHVVDTGTTGRAYIGEVYRAIICARLHGTTTDEIVDALDAYCATIDDSEEIELGYCPDSVCENVDLLHLLADAPVPFEL